MRRVSVSMEQKPSLWLPSQEAPPRRRIDNATLLSVSSLAATIALGLLGLMIPFWLLIPAIVFCGIVLAVSLWRSDWLFRKPTHVRVSIVVTASIIYFGIAGSALWHILRAPMISAAPLPAPLHPPPGPKTEGPCSPVVLGNGNTVTACSDSDASIPEK